METSDISTNQDLDKLIASKDLVLLAFSAKWCSLCKTIKQTMSQAIGAASKSLAVASAIVDIDEAEDLTSEHNIRSLPTILVFNKNGLQEKILSKDLVNTSLEHIIEKYQA